MALNNARRPLIAVLNLYYVLMAHHDVIYSYNILLRIFPRLPNGNLELKRKKILGYYLKQLHIIILV